MPSSLGSLGINILDEEVSYETIFIPVRTYILAGHPSWSDSTLGRYRAGRRNRFFQMANQKLKLPSHHLQGADFLVDLSQPLSADCNDFFDL